MFHTPPSLTIRCGVSSDGETLKISECLTTLLCHMWVGERKEYGVMIVKLWNGRGALARARSPFIRCSPTSLG